MSEITNFLFINGEYIAVTSEYPTRDLIKQIKKDAVTSGVIPPDKILSNYYGTWYLYDGDNGNNYDFIPTKSLDEAVERIFKKEEVKEINVPAQLNVLTGNPIK